MYSYKIGYQEDCILSVHERDTMGLSNLGHHCSYLIQNFSRFTEQSKRGYFNRSCFKGSSRVGKDFDTFVQGFTLYNFDLAFL